MYLSHLYASQITVTALHKYLFDTIAKMTPNVMSSKPLLPKVNG